MFENSKRLKICVITAVFFIVFIFNMAQNVFAVETLVTDDGYQVAYDNAGSEIIAIYSDASNNNVLRLRGIHNKGTSNIAYVTTGYTLSLKKNAANLSDTRTGNYLTVKREDSGIPDTVSGNKIISYYKITIDDKFIKNLFIMWKKENSMSGSINSKAWWSFRDALKSGIDVYMSNIFAVIKRDTKGNEIYRSGDYNNDKKATGKMFYTLKTMLNAGKTLKMFDVWSDKTQGYLPNYYDVKFKIYISIYKLEAEFADEDGNIIKTTSEVADNYLENNQESYFLPGDAVNVKLKESASEIKTKDGTKYKINSDRKAEIIFGESTEKFAGNRNMVYEYKNSVMSDCIIRIYYDKAEPEITPTPTLMPSPSLTPTPSLNLTPALTPTPAITHVNTPTPAPTLTLAPTPIPTLGPPVIKRVYNTEFVLDETKPYLETAINSNRPGAEIFDAREAIPVIEELYVRVNGKKYLLKAEFIKTSGIIKIPVMVRKKYILCWKDNNEEREIYQKFEVEKEFSYTSLKNYTLYGADKIEINNELLPDGQVLFENITDDNVPIEIINYGDEVFSRCIIPSEHELGMDFGTEYVFGDDFEKRPAFSEAKKKKEMREEAELSMENILCRSDYFAIDGTIILSDDWYGESAAEPAVYGGVGSFYLLKTGFEIPENKKNIEYKSYGHAVYKEIVRQNNFNINSDYSINVNSIKVYTPVYAEFKVESDNKKYVQYIRPDENAVPVVLGENSETSDFYVQISNYGYHSAYKGYKTRDYFKYVAFDNETAMNQIRFPIDVIADINDNFDVSDDILIKAGEWYSIGNRRVRFYMPAYVSEKTVKAKVRSVAVNAERDLDKEESIANKNRNNYTAFDEKNFQITGRIYGMTMYDISDYPLWEEVFRGNDELKINKFDYDEWRFKTYDGTNSHIFKNSMLYEYGAGIYDSIGNLIRDEKYTFPLVNGSHPKYKNRGMYIPGSLIRFKINTTGIKMSKSGAYIEIKPTFYLLDDNGIREDVDLYYYISENRKRKLVKIGSSEDKNNIKQEMVFSNLLDIRKEEIKYTLNADKFNYNLKYKLFNMFSYSYIKPAGIFRMYSGFKYAEESYDICRYSEFMPDIKDMLIKSIQTRYFNYCLPANIIVVKKDYPIFEYIKNNGISYDEDFIIKDGFVIVNFNIAAYDSEGKEYLSYLNIDNEKLGYCNMWKMEGAGFSKIDFSEKRFEFKYGDVLLFDCSDLMKNYYKSEALY